jgi:hypothetical protein
MPRKKRVRVPVTSSRHGTYATAQIGNVGPGGITLPPPDTTFDVKLTVAEAAIIQFTLHEGIHAIEMGFPGGAINDHSGGWKSVDPSKLPPEQLRMMGLLNLMAEALGQVASSTLPMSLYTQDDGTVVVNVLDMRVRSKHGTN